MGLLTQRRDIDAAIPPRQQNNDLNQLRQVAHENDWQVITAPGGALEAVIKAKESEGKVRHIGVTSHRQSSSRAVRLR